MCASKKSTTTKASIKAAQASNVMTNKKLWKQFPVQIASVQKAPAAAEMKQAQCKFYELPKLTVFAIPRTHDALKNVTPKPTNTYTVLLKTGYSSALLLDAGTKTLLSKKVMFDEKSVVTPMATSIGFDFIAATADTVSTFETRHAERCTEAATLIAAVKDLLTEGDFKILQGWIAQETVAPDSSDYWKEERNDDLYDEIMQNVFNVVRGKPGVSESPEPMRAALDCVVACSKLAASLVTRGTVLLRTLGAGEDFLFDGATYRVVSKDTDNFEEVLALELKTQKIITFSPSEDVFPKTTV